jgi:hypothetical protein
MTFEISRKESYQLPNETIPSLEFSGHLTDIVAMRDFINQCGIDTRNTRIERYIAYLNLICSEGPDDASKIFKNSIDSRFRNPTDWLLYVLREVHELAWIFKGLRQNSPIGIDGKLKILVSGSDFAALDVDSASRDTQFELRIASYFCQAGCNVDLSQETDIIASTTDRAFYIECKRVASNGKLGKRLAEAKKQLANRIPKKISGLDVYGCVAADVTKLAFPHNGLTIGLTNEHSKYIVQKKLLEISSEAQKSPLFRDCDQLLFYWLQIHIAGIIYHPATPITRFSSFQLSRSGLRRKERRAAKVFYDIFESASRGSDPRELPPQKLKARRQIDVPAGTTFSLNDHLVADILERQEINEVEADEVIGKLSINGKEHRFFTLDVQMLKPHLSREWKSNLTATPIETGLRLLLELYLQRFPYEE